MFSVLTLQCEPVFFFSRDDSQGKVLLCFNKYVHISTSDMGYI